MRHAPLGSDMRKNVAILGSTGSIGVNTLEVITLHPDAFQVFGLSASTNLELILYQCITFKPIFAVMASESHGRELKFKCKAQGLKTEVFWGNQAITDLASHDSVDIVMAAIVGAAGLGPCLGAARSGKKLLLANKEALVVGGSLFMKEVENGGAQLLPIDSEHSAIFQSLPDDPHSWIDQVDKIILTASGGPFRTYEWRNFSNVTVEQACSHPNWIMGRKISVDSATMMNKALEVIEAKFLFGLRPNQIEVVIHPQSVIHSMVQYKDNSIVAQLGTPDMKGPIAYGLSFPNRIESGASAIDFTKIAPLTFESLDDNENRQRFPGLALAWEVLDATDGTTAVLNAANEVAVSAFLDKKICFNQIHRVNLEVVNLIIPKKSSCLEDLLDLDRQCRNAAYKVVKRLQSY